MRAPTPAPSGNDPYLQCLPPVVAENTRILILGSLPGSASLQAGQYYAFRHNQFWRLMSAVLACDLAALDYPARLQGLLAHGVGLWDVVGKAQREGSLDSRIRDHAANDLIALLDRLPRLTTIAFNGGTAARLGLKKLGQRSAAYKIVQLPSSSPAYTLAYAEKLQQWLALRPL